MHYICCVLQVHTHCLIPSRFCCMWRSWCQFGHILPCHTCFYPLNPVMKIVRSKLASLPPPPLILPYPNFFPSSFSLWISVQCFLYFTTGVDALPAKNNPPQQRVFEVQQPKPEVQLPPPQAHPHYHHPTPSPSHQEKTPRLLSLHNKVEEHHDNRFDQPNLSQLDYNVSTTSKNLRMDVSGSGNELGGWRRGRGGVWVEEGGCGE